MLGAVQPVVHVNPVAWYPECDKAIALGAQVQLIGVQRQRRWFHSCVHLVERLVLSADAQPRQCCSLSGWRREELQRQPVGIAEGQA